MDSLKLVPSLTLIVLLISLVDAGLIWVLENLHKLPL